MPLRPHDGKCCVSLWGFGESCAGLRKMKGQGQCIKYQHVQWGLRGQYRATPGHWLAHLREVSTHKPSVMERKNTDFIQCFCVWDGRVGRNQLPEWCFITYSGLERTSWQGRKSGCLWGSRSLASRVSMAQLKCITLKHFLKYFWDQIFSNLLLDLFTRLRFLAQSSLLHNAHLRAVRPLPSPVLSAL